MGIIGDKLELPEHLYHMRVVFNGRIEVTCSEISIAQPKPGLIVHVNLDIARTTISLCC